MKKIINAVRHYLAVRKQLRQWKKWDRKHPHMRNSALRKLAKKHGIPVFDVPMSKCKPSDFKFAAPRKWDEV